MSYASTSYNEWPMLSSRFEYHTLFTPGGKSKSSPDSNYAISGLTSSQNNFSKTHCNTAEFKLSPNNSLENVGVLPRKSSSKMSRMFNKMKSFKNQANVSIETPAPLKSEDYDEIIEEIYYSYLHANPQLHSQVSRKEKEPTLISMAKKTISAFHSGEDSTMNKLKGYGSCIQRRKLSDLDSQLDNLISDLTSFKQDYTFGKIEDDNSLWNLSYEDSIQISTENSTEGQTNKNDSMISASTTNKAPSAVLNKENSSAPVKLQHRKSLFKNFKFSDFNTTNFKTKVNSAKGILVPIDKNTDYEDEAFVERMESGIVKGRKTYDEKKDGAGVIYLETKSEIMPSRSMRLKRRLSSRVSYKRFNVY
ncbi:hypothetical protein HYPBUDRAFT_147413 [Hyphopichia burtonii NRRL Y-1933]|uniref:Uncharacterized protein n=1 Tax=Hyphopichia burtonii NRRL Y-1933 TaxID=984485 RepID=A0A1E4RNM7_9ASCO|nr:hypothetical protein HYPBUDRAFT_147413 [Hyphopichia burtonii NRRL Y-1933]ODV68884.1 hypothetical protein HYPBUDRAFT_147413 [Hyphopichia burtonii NRRL Y-1933]